MKATIRARVPGATAIAIGLAIACIVGCSAGPRTASPGPPVTEIAIDMTGSSRSWQPVMINNLEVVLDVVARERGIAIVTPIDENSAAHAVHLAQVSFAVDDGGNAIKRRRLTDAARRSVLAHVRRALATTPLSHGSDQFGALASAAHDLQQYPPSRRARVVLLSDMVNTVGGAPYRLTRGDVCARRRQVIAALRRDRLLPDLHGLQIWVGGGGLNHSSALSVKQEQCLRALWLDVFAAAGSTSTQYAASLADPGRSE